MQTIGKTTDEMEFPSTWTDILLKSISSKANSYTIDVKIGAKRVAAAEQDVPKKRRKQPNPTRISADEKCSDVVGGAETANGEEPPQPSSSPLNLTARPLKSAKNDPVGHRPDAVSHNRPPRVSDGCSPAAASSSPDDGPFGNRPATTVGLGAAVQIFNPEAFCELCNKEFCNKYFLKTHKANKHGVFADGVPNGSLLQHDPPPPPDKTHQQLLTASRGGEHTAASGNGGGTSFKNLAPPPFGRPQVHAQTAAKGAHHNNNNNNNNQTRAFCDVCHKEFCNKYFVRRHKAKIHGMTDDCGDQCGRPTAWGGDEQPAVPSFPIKNETVLDFAVSGANHVLLLSDGTPRSPGKPSEDGGTARSVIVEAPCRHAVKLERPSADEEEDEYEEEEEDEQADRSFASRDEPRDGYAHEPAEYDESQLLWNNEFADVESAAWRRLTTEEPGVRENRGRSGVANVAAGTGVIVKNACRNDDGSRDSLSPSPPRGSVKSGGERRAEPGDSSAAPPSSSFCKICNKELCNKYFMRTHMQRMHGISVRNGDHIGGVVCDVCNKELCSKYFLRVHKQNSHGIVSENGGGGGVLHQRYWPDVAAAAENGQLSSADEHPPDSAAGQLLHRYYRHYAEACNVCFRRFKSPKWLSAHLLNDHGDEGRAQWNHVQNHMLQQQQADETAAAGLQSAEDQQQPPPPPPPPLQQMKQYRCSYCPFATSVLSFLFVHEKFHSAENGRGEHAAAADAFPAHACGACFVAFPDRARWQEHVTRCRAAREPFAAAADGGGSPASDACRQYSTNEDSGSAADKSPPDANGRTVAEPPANQEPFIMQSFFLENCSVSPQSVDRSESCGDGGGGRSDSFHSSLVYLPVKEKLTSTVNVFFKLTPT